MAHEEKGYVKMLCDEECGFAKKNLDNVLKTTTEKLVGTAPWL